jgi:hypothetical protein
MLTGRTSFAHDSVAETLSAILSHDPDWTRLPAGTPAAVRLLLRRCLERDPRNRLRDIGEARIALGESAPKETPPVTSRRWSLLLAGALVAALLVGAALAWFPWSRSADVSGAGGITLKQLTELPGPELHPDLSPDGRQVVFASAAAGNTVWSPDGRRVLTVSTTPGKSGAWIFDAATLATQENSTFFASPLAPRFAAEFWSPNGRSVAGSILDPTGQPHQPAVWEVATGEIRTLEVPSPVNRFAFGVAGWFPNSSRFLFASGLGLAAVDADTGAWRPFPAPEDAIRYRLSRDGQTLHTERDILDADI